MERRYQIFVSSTYEDLKEERAKVITALLNIGHIPCGMEYFPATNEDAWECIERLIPQCDYYIVLVAGKYGSIAPGDTKSYTHKEYELALKHQIPILGLLHKDPDSLPHKDCESDPKMRCALAEFRSQVGKKLCRFWTTADQIPGELLFSLTSQIDRFPKPGWVRGDSVASDEAKNEIIKLRQDLEKKERIIERLHRKETEYDDQLASGDEEFRLRGCFQNHYYSIRISKDCSARMYKLEFDLVATWNRLLRLFAVKGLNHWTSDELKTLLQGETCDLVKRTKSFSKLTEWPEVYSFINDEGVKMIEVQLNALGLSEKRDYGWSLTKKGLLQSNRQLALRKNERLPASTNWCRIVHVSNSPIRSVPIRDFAL